MRKKKKAWCNRKGFISFCFLKFHPAASFLILNAEQAEYKKIKLAATTDLVPDKRIENILKRFKDK